MSDSDESRDGRRGPRSKVARLIERYDLEGAGAELERRWTAEGPASASLRELASWFNCRLLRAALAERDGTPLEGEVENLYRLLTDDDVSSGARTRAVHELRRAGVDVDRLESQFVSHRAVHTYLTNYRGVTPPSEREGDEGDGDRLATRRETVQRLAGRLERVADESVEQLAATGDLRFGNDPEVYVDVRVHCPDCDAQFGIHELLARGGCDCR